MIVRILAVFLVSILLGDACHAQSSRRSNRRGVVSKLASAAKQTTSTAAANTTTTTLKARASTSKVTTSTQTADLSSTVSAEIKAADAKKEGSAGDKVLLVSITGELRERGDHVVLFGQQTKSLKSYLDLLRRVREDKAYKAVIVRLSSAQLGVAMAQELRLGIEELRAKGKEVIAVIEDDSQASYMVALAANKVVLPPSGDLMLHGVKADSYFLRQLLQKIGVSVQIVHVGQYKSYGETFTNDDYTTPARQNMSEIVDDMYDQLVSVIAKDRKLTREQAEAAVNRGPVSAAMAAETGLVDRVAYTEEVLSDYTTKGSEVVLMDDYTKESSTKSDDLSLFSIFSMMKKNSSSSSSSSDSSSKLPQVAVLYAVGSIVLGSDEGVGLGSDEQIASEDIIETLEEIAADDKVKGVILRINSPGGSAFASDLIWKKIEEVKKKKPIVASMSDVAASGGYYIAMGASKIIAEPGTLTGSIGVVGGKPNLRGLYDKVGVTKTSISKGDYAHLFSETSDFSEKERELIENMMKTTYNEFITKAAQGRKMSVEELNEVAQGRVWTGARAHKVGLVDELGGMSTAIREMKALLGIKNDDKVALVAYPKDVSLFEMLSKALGGNVTARVSASAAWEPFVASRTALPPGLARAFDAAMNVSRMFQRERVLAIMPFVPQIN